MAAFWHPSVVVKGYRQWSDPMRPRSCIFAFVLDPQLARCHRGVSVGTVASFADLSAASNVRSRTMILTSEIMKTLPEAILAYAHRCPEGSVLSPKKFLHMGNRMAVDQALSRLAREGRLIRVERGAYMALVRGQTSGRPPLVEKC